jgi:hypothetical protein
MMFYDPTCKPEVKADPFSLESLIAWLEKQPAGDVYCWSDTEQCLLGQWARAMGVPEKEVANKSTELDTCAPFDDIALLSPFTFGAALERAIAAAR